VKIYRRLAANNPAANEPDLAGSLSNLGLWLTEAGRPANALAPGPGLGESLMRALDDKFPDELGERCEHMETAEGAGDDVQRQHQEPSDDRVDVSAELAEEPPHREGHQDVPQNLTGGGR
jgi:hypothetical protein